jgi:hypothetical protein
MQRRREPRIDQGVDLKTVQDRKATTHSASNLVTAAWRDTRSAPRTAGWNWPARWQYPRHVVNRLPRLRASCGAVLPSLLTLLFFLALDREQVTVFRDLDVRSGRAVCGHAIASADIGNVVDEASALAFIGLKEKGVRSARHYLTYGRSTSRASRKPRLTSSSLPSNFRSSCSMMIGPS